jgi:hypothetical protein
MELIAEERHAENIVQQDMSSFAMPRQAASEVGYKRKSGSPSWNAISSSFTPFL